MDDGCCCGYWMRLGLGDDIDSGRQGSDKEYVRMPLNEKGRKIKAAMIAKYGKEKGERVFYASENAGTIKGVKKHGKSLATRPR